MKFMRNTHNADGSVRKELPRLGYEGRDVPWPTCDIHMLSSKGVMTIKEIYDAHAEYDKQWEPEGYGFSVADILDGLADLLRLGIVKIAPNIPH